VNPFIDAYIAHRLDREAQILRALAGGATRIKDMVPVLYADVNPELHPAAARSVLGHIVDLARRGKVVTEGNPGPDNDYRLAG